MYPSSLKLPMASGQGSPPVMWKSVTKALSKHCLPRAPPPSRARVPKAVRWQGPSVRAGCCCWCWWCMVRNGQRRRGAAAQQDGARPPSAGLVRAGRIRRLAARRGGAARRTEGPEPSRLLLHGRPRAAAAGLGGVVFSSVGMRGSAARRLPAARPGDGLPTWTAEEDGRGGEADVEVKARADGGRGAGAGDGPRSTRGQRTRRRRRPPPRLRTGRRRRQGARACAAAATEYKAQA